MLLLIAKTVILRNSHVIEKRERTLAVVNVVVPPCAFRHNNVLIQICQVFRLFFTIPNCIGIVYDTFIWINISHFIQINRWEHHRVMSDGTEKQVSSRQRDIINRPILRENASELFVD